LSRKRRQDTWNEKAEELEELMESETDQFVDNVAHNREGISAEREKFILNETTTPKILPPNKRS